MRDHFQASVISTQQSDPSMPVCQDTLFASRQFWEECYSCWDHR